MTTTRTHFTFRVDTWSFDDPMNVMTSANSLLPILRRLDEVARKLDRMRSGMSSKLPQHR